MLPPILAKHKRWRMYAICRITVALLAPVIIAGFVRAASASKANQVFEFEVPEHVLKLTRPDPSQLPKELTEPRAVTVVSMRSELEAKVKFGYYGFGMTIVNYSGSDVLIVANGRPVRRPVYNADEKAGRTGLFVIGKVQAPVPYRWFEKYGDPLFIGMFPLEAGNKITRGHVYAFRFADLIDPQGRLRRVTFGLSPSGGISLSEIKPVYIKPAYNNHNLSPVIELVPGAKPLVIKAAPIPNPGPVVPLPALIVEEHKTWCDLRSVKSDDGKLIGLVVRSVKPGSPYAEAGLKAGMVITRMKISEASGDLTQASGWTKGDIVFEVFDFETSLEPRTIRVPAESLRQAMTSPRSGILAPKEP